MAGESGSGKSETGKAIADELEMHGVKSVLLCRMTILLPDPTMPSAATRCRVGLITVQQPTLNIDSPGVLSMTALTIHMRPAAARAATRHAEYIDLDGKKKQEQAVEPTLNAYGRRLYGREARTADVWHKASFN